MSDRLAKAFDFILSETLGNDSGAHVRMRHRGWKEFIDCEYPKTTDPVLMAIAAVEYIGLDDDGQWCNEPMLILAVIHFLREETAYVSTMDQLLELKALLGVQPVQKPSLHEWFYRVYSS